MSRTFLKKKDEYIKNTFAKEDELLKRIRAKLQADNKDGINIAPTEAKMLQFFIKSLGIKTIVEVGTLYGYSALWMARALPDDGKIICIEKDENNYKIAKELLEDSESAEKIELINGDAVEILNTLNGPFDMAFIDADKGGYKNYLNWSMENIRPGGLIIGDNTFLFGHIYGEGRSDINASSTQKEAMSYFNETLANHSDYTTALFPTDEGMTVAFKHQE